MKVYGQKKIKKIKSSSQIGGWEVDEENWWRENNRFRKEEKNEIKIEKE